MMSVMMQACPSTTRHRKDVGLILWRVVLFVVVRMCAHIAIDVFGVVGSAFTVAVEAYL